MSVPTKGDTLPSNFIYLRISSICRAEACVKASKILTFDSNKLSFKSGKSSTHSIAVGNKFHSLYSNYMLAYKSFDGERVKALLNSKVSKSTRGHPVFTKTIDDKIIVAGMFDSLMVLSDNGKKYTVLLELKSTTKKMLYAGELRSAIKQLQLYMWLMKERLEQIGYPLFRLAYLEVVSQKDGKFIKRIPVEYDPDIEDWIRNLVKIYNGQEQMRVPPYKYCKECYSQVRSICDWYRSRSKVYGKQH